MIQFPKNFLWGSSTSGPQTEGRASNDGKGDNDWDYWFSREPNRFYQGIGPDKASTFYENFESDIDLLVETGHKIFRTSIQWSRIFPNGRGEINQVGLAFYKTVFKKIKEKGIKLMVNLYHFDLPFELEKEGGWEKRQVVEDYLDYAKICFSEFNDLVDYWITFNEPIVPVECGYFYNYHYPNKVDKKLAIQVAYHTQLASSMAVKACHEIKKNSKIGIILNLTPAYPRSMNPLDIKAANIAELFQAKSYLDPSVKGKYPSELINLLKTEDILPIYQESELKIIEKNCVDFLGVNYYQPLRVSSPTYMLHSDSPMLFEKYYEKYEMPGKKINPYRGWEIYEKGIYDIANNIKENYGNIEWFLTENGMGVENEERYRENGIIQDDYRIDFIKNHLIYLHKAISEGSNCKGYLVWTFIDCWSWLNSYKNRYGLIELNVENQKRILKKSGYWFKELSEHNGF